jgi:hypothetical protein
MKQNLKKELAQHKLLLISSTFSFLLLLIFSISQDNDAKMLGLEVKWLAVSAIPILIGLFIGGYIKNFKGFGLELEYNLKEPIPSKVISEINVIESPALEKGKLDSLYNLNTTEKSKINRLRFITGRRHYYDSHAIAEHFLHLNKLQFIKVVNENREFLFVISIKNFRQGNNRGPDNINFQKISDFVLGVENNDFSRFLFEIVNDYVLMTDSIIEAFRKITKSEQSKRLLFKKEVLPILNQERKMIGIVELQNLSLTIAEEVEKIIN